MKSCAMTRIAPSSYEDELSLYSLATEYLHAAEILIETRVVKHDVSLVAFCLLGHAAELLMKSFLYKEGVPLNVLRLDIGHDLEQLVSRVQAVGLHPPLELPHIRALSKNYKEKSTEYRQLKAMSHPPKDLLLLEIQALSSRVFNNVATWPK
jgi:hypothetical protein